MDRITRKELKTDKFALEIGHTVEFFETHRGLVLRYGAIALALILAVVAYYFYTRNQGAQRQRELHAAMQIQDAGIGPPSDNPLIPVFPTPEERAKAATKAFTDLATRYPAKDEAWISRYYLGMIAFDQGKVTEAQKILKEVAESGSANYASLAKLSLASLYAATGRLPEAERLLRSVIDKPTLFVSKEQAAIALARLLAKSKPEEARKLLDPLRTERSAVSRAAITALAELTGR